MQLAFRPALNVTAAVDALREPRKAASAAMTVALVFFALGMATAQAPVTRCAAGSSGWTWTQTL